MTKKSKKKKSKKIKLPIKYWSYSSLIAYLRNPLAWYKRYVEEVYDAPISPSSIIGCAGHVALQHFYSGVDKSTAVALGLEYLRGAADKDIGFGRTVSLRVRRKKREHMEREYLQAIAFYLERPPKHTVLGVEVKSTVAIEGFLLPLKAVSDLVVASRAEKGAVDIIDHKFVSTFSSKCDSWKPIFLIQALFNYYTISELYGKPVRRFIVYECKKTRNVNGSSQLRRHIIDYSQCKEDFIVFQRLINDATNEIARSRSYLPNPSDMFEGAHSFDIYRLNLINDNEENEND